jgi:DNA-binding transcriptional MerR regulator
VVRRVTGASLRQLDYWDTIGFLKPSGQSGKRTGWRDYTFEDLVRVRAVVRLRNEGISLQMIQKVIEALRDHGADPLRELKLVVSGGRVFVCHGRDALYDAVSRQATFLFMDLDHIARETEELVRAA